MPRTSREVVFVDGVRTPFGKAGSMYAETRADDLIINCLRALLRRHPELPAGPGRRGRDRRHHADRRPGPDDRPDRGPAGRAAPVGAGLRHRSDVRGGDDGGHHGGLGHRVRGLRRRHRRWGRTHGPAPDGRGRRSPSSDPRREARRRVGPGDGFDGGEPARPLPGDHPRPRRCLRGAESGAGGLGLRRGRHPGVPGPRGDPERRSRMGPGHRRRTTATGHHDRDPGRSQDSLPPARTGDPRQRRRV